MKALAGIALAFCASGAVAAPFCVVSASGERCHYYSFPACQEAAERSRGACVVQTEQEPAQPTYQRRQQQGGPPFCVVTSYATNCWYYSLPPCQEAAARSRGACVVNPDR